MKHYPTIFKERVIEYLEEEHRIGETSKIFKVTKTTVLRWKKQWEEKGHLEKKELNRAFKKIDPEKLKVHVKEHADAYIHEVAEDFNCSPSGIRKAYKRLGIKRKKK